MAFKFKYFLAGAAKEATRLQDERRKQAMETIQNSLELQGRDRLEKKTLRDKEIQQLAVTAKELSNLGLEDDQIKLVLSQGVDRAAEIATALPTAAAKKRVDPKEFLALIDVGEAGKLSVEEFIQRGQIAGRTEVGSFNKVTGMPKGIFGGTFDDVEASMRAQYESTFGLGGEQQPAVAGPRGQIDIMGMMGSDSEGYEFTGNQQQKAFTDYLSAASGMKGGVVNGELIWSSETPGIQTMVSQHVNDLLVKADQLKRKGSYSDAQIRQMVLSEFEASAPEGAYNFNNQTAAALRNVITRPSATNAGEGGEAAELDQALASGNVFKVAQLLKSTQPEVYGRMDRNELMQAVAEMVNKVRSSQVGVTQ
jgi:hypothetical protein